MSTKWKYAHGQAIPLVASTALHGKAGGITLKGGTYGKAIVQGTAVSEGLPNRWLGQLFGGDSAGKNVTTKMTGVPRLVASGVISAGYLVEPTVDLSTVRVAREYHTIVHEIAAAAEAISAKNAITIPWYVYDVSTIRTFSFASTPSGGLAATTFTYSAGRASSADKWCWSTTGKTYRVNHALKTGDIIVMNVWTYGGANATGRAIETATNGGAVHIKLGW